MKTLRTILALCIILLSITSCKKEYECRCESKIFNPHAKATGYDTKPVFKAKNNAKAREVCAKYDVRTDPDKPTYTCYALSVN